MTTLRPMTRPTNRLAALALAATVLPACDSESPRDVESFEIEFRDDYKTSGQKLNTSFLGEDEEVPFDQLPFIAGAVPGSEVLEIRARYCRDSAGMVLGPSSFSTALVGLEVSVSPDGRLGPQTMRKVADPSVECTVSDELWADTYWEIVHDDDGTTVETDLWLRSIDLDSHGSTVYEWYVERDRVTGMGVGTGNYQPVCDENIDPLNPGLEYHSYLVPGMSIGPQATFQIDTSHSSAYMACLSGAIGKSASWGYTPWDYDTQTHEMATRMVRADYCGDGTSNTQPGTLIWVESPWGPDPEAPDENDPLEYEVEAVWDFDHNRASCVDVARLDPHGTQTGHQCSGFSLPTCTNGHFNGQSTKIFTYTPTVQ